MYCTGVPCVPVCTFGALLVGTLHARTASSGYHAFYSTKGRHVPSPFAHPPLWLAGRFGLRRLCRTFLSIESPSLHPSADNRLLLSRLSLRDLNVFPSPATIAPNSRLFVFPLFPSDLTHSLLPLCASTRRVSLKRYQRVAFLFLKRVSIPFRSPPVSTT